MFKSRIWFLWLLLIISVKTHAALIDLGNTTLDTDSGLEWLDLNLTTNLSYDNVISESGIDGALQSWRYATGEEVESLFSSAGGVGPYEGWSEMNNGVVTTLLDFWGSTETNAETSWFIFGDTNSNGLHYMGLIGDNPTRDNTDTLDFMSLYFDVVLGDQSSLMMGSALVRGYEVPLPASIWLFISGLLMLLTRITTK